MKPQPWYNGGVASLVRRAVLLEELGMLIYPAWE